MVQPRFKARSLIRFNFSNFKRYFNKETIIENFLKDSTNKNIILNYSQLRIALLHFLFNEIPSGSHIATSCYTIYDMVNVIISAGHTPVFVDINNENLSPDIDALIKLIKSNKVKAVIFTHLHGYKVCLKNLKNICIKHNCILIEDCAQSLWNPKWSKTDNIPGFYADVALFSTGFFKVVNSISGGYLLFNNKNNNFDKLKNDYLKLKTNLSFDFFYRFIYGIFFYALTNRFIFKLLLFPVLKYSRRNNIEFVNKRSREENNPKLIKRTKKSILRMNFLQRFFVRFQDISSLNSDYQKRKVIANLYLENLKDLLERELIIIPGLSKSNNWVSMNDFSIYYQIPVICNFPEELITFLVNHNIDIARQHIKNLPNYETYKRFSNNSTNKAEEISKNLILLPCYPDLRLNNVKKIIYYIRKFYSQKDEKKCL